METTIRTLGLEDYDGWMSVWKRAGLHFVKPRGRDSRQSFAEQLARRTCIMLGLEMGGELVGVVLASHDGRKGWLNRLAVVPEHRCKGLGALLVAEAERILRSQGISVFGALIENDNAASLALFRSQGYAEDPPGVRYLSKRSSEDD